MSLFYKEGDLIKLAQQGFFDLIIHGCNCFCQMGAGIAKQIKKTFPAAYLADQKTTIGDRKKLGSCSFTKCQVKGGFCKIINAYTQFHWSSFEKQIDYQAIRLCLKWIKENFSGQKMGLPKIGAGLAGGDWSIIEKIILAELEGEDITIVIKS